MKPNTQSRTTKPTMKFLVRSVLLALLVQNAPASLIEPLISGGEMALPGQFPYQVLLGNINQTTTCSGSLIDPHWVLTSASCVSRNDASYTVTLGVFDLMVDAEESRLQFSVTKVTKHENYDPTTGDNDIALMQLDTGVVQNDFIAPIRLPSVKQANKGFLLWNGSVSGWGYTSDKPEESSVLRWFDSRVVPNFFCKLRNGGKAVRDTNICLASFWKKGTCIGDSGNPLVITDWDGNQTLLGIASNDAFACDNHRLPIFTKVGSYLSWISEKTNIQLRQ